MGITNKTRERITSKLKRYQNIVNKAISDDINESDTVTIITDILCDIFGFDKYDNVTSEFSIRKTYCDLAIKINNKVPLLIECKAVGIDLKEDHIRQATNYGADSGIEWIVLTNARDWKIFKIEFTQPIDKQLVYEFSLADISARKAETLELLYPLCIESFPKGKADGLELLYSQKQVLNRYVIGQLLVSEEIENAIRKKFRKLFPDIKVDTTMIDKIIVSEIVKREIYDPDQSKEAVKILKKAEKKVAAKSKVSNAE